MKEAMPGVQPYPIARRIELPLAARDGLHWFDWFFVGAALLGIGSSPYWKTQGPSVLVGLAVLVCSYAAYGYFSYGILLRNRILLAWTILGILHVGLSWMDWLPGTPVFYGQEYVLRMGYFTFLVYPATAAFYLLFLRIRQARKMRLLAWFNIFCMSCSALTYHFFPAYDGHWRVEGQSFSLIADMMAVLNYAVDNVSLLFWWGVLFLAFERPWRMVLVLGVMFLSNSAQMMLVAILTTTVWLYVRPEKLVLPISLSIVIGLPFVALLLVLFANDLGVDSNTIGRANWWIETLRGVIDNFGFAYGFGSDNITDYHVDNRFQMLGKRSELPIQAVHNEFVYMFHSIGMLGGYLFIMFYLKELRPRIVGEIKLFRHACLMFLIICLTTSVNVALVSPTFVFGLCWIYGYLLQINSQTVPVALP